MIKALTLIMAMTLPLLCLHGQNLSSIGTKKIVELESAQSEITETIVVAVMERDISNSTKVLLYRSTDQAASWSLIDSITPAPGDNEIPDPVIASDAEGHFYVSIMRVNRNGDPSLMTVDIEVYRSLDDGQSWTLAGTPHFSDAIADYPQLIALNDGELYLVYSYITGFPIISGSTLTFKKSIDGGENWLPGAQAGAESIKSIGPDIARGFDNSLLISVGATDSSYIYGFSSTDAGNTWNSLAKFPISNQETGHITKPVTHPDFDFYGIISHKPHMENSAIYYHSSIEGTLSSQILDEGAYAQGYLTDDGVIHIIYSKNDDGVFKIIYRFSNDHGQTFTAPISLYSQTYSTSAFGEYQSLIYGKDELFYLTFCDWSDNSSAKTLVFPPSITLSTQQSTSNDLQIYPNPVSDILSIELPENIPYSGIRIIDGKGQIVDQLDIQKGLQSINYDISHLSGGIYILGLISENKILVKKIIKM
jgi:hypothetical protein